MVAVVTSMSLEGYELYGKTFIESFKKFAPRDWGLDIWSEDELPVPFIDIESVPGYKEFIEGWKLKEATLSNDTLTNYRYQAGRFCHKPFAVFGSRFLLNRRDSILWFDADVEFMEEVTYTDVCAILPYFAGVSLLCREQYEHSEAGFIGFGKSSCDVINLWHKFYTSGALYKLREWHDVMALDAAIGLANVFTKNLTVKDCKHPWPHSPLGRFSVHHKGPGRKTEKFGDEIGGATVTDKVEF